MSSVSVQTGSTRRTANSSAAISLAIPVSFAPPAVTAFGAAAAQAQALRAGTFVGDVAQGGSCNCNTLSLTPHCHGTHTESVAHLTGEAHPVAALATGLYLARLISITAQGEISRAQLQAAAGTLHDHQALVIRTLPNHPDKRTRNYDGNDIPAWFAADALAWLNAQGIEHLLVDVPSVDHLHDAQLPAHRAFWGLPAGSTRLHHATRPAATITELVYVPDHASDGDYLLNLQVAPLLSDAAPSRPLLYPLLENT